jgi:hypothetical protein
MAVVEQKNLESVDKDRVRWPSPNDVETSAVSTYRGTEPQSPDRLTRALFACLRWGIAVIAVGAIVAVIFLVVGSFLSGR